MAAMRKRQVRLARDARLSPKTICTRAAARSIGGKRCKQSELTRCNIGRTGTGIPSTTGARSKLVAKKRRRKVCGLPLTKRGTLAQLRARVLIFGDLKQRTATSFFAAD